jgi:methyltransferase
VDVTRIAYLVLLAAVGLGRVVELRISRTNQKDMIARGAARVSEPHFQWMVFVHTAVLIGAAAEVIFLRRPLIPALAIPMTILFLLSNALRWWVIRTLRSHWNVQIVNSAPLGVVSDGPYRWVRHPNYAAVFVELIALPLIYTAWISALVAAIGNGLVLHSRLAVEDQMLLSDASYRAAMGNKPRFLPKFNRRFSGG